MNEQTMTKLVEMKMNGMAEAYAEQSSNSDFKRMEFDDRLALLIDFEHSRRKNSKLNRLIQSASFINSTACQLLAKAASSSVKYICPTDYILQVVKAWH